MFLADFVTALVIGVIFAFILAAIFGRSAWGIPFVFILVIIFGVTWAGGVWVTPFGPTFYGSYWMAFLLIGFIVTIVFAAIIPSGRSRKSIRARERESGTKEPEPEVTAIGNFFWILLVVLFIILLVYYL